MNFTLHQLQVFLKVTQTMSVTKAAEELSLTQPAVSIQLRNLQDQFELPLTEVVGRRIYVTDFGREIARIAENILNEVYTLNYRNRAHKGLLTGKLRICTVSTGKYVMPYFLSGFMEDHEGIDLFMDVTNKSRVVESLEGNEVDFALVSILPPTLQLDKIELMENRLYLVGRSDKIPKKKVFEKSLLEEHPVIFREEGSGTRHMMEKFLIRNKIKLNKKLVLSSNEAVKQALLAGLGISVMPAIGIKNELKSGELRILPLKGLPMVSRWYIVWNKNKQFSSVAQAFLEYLKQHKLEIIRESFGGTEEIV